MAAITSLPQILINRQYIMKLYSFILWLIYSGRLTYSRRINETIVVVVVVVVVVAAAAAASAAI